MKYYYNAETLQTIVVSEENATDDDTARQFISETLRLPGMWESVDMAPA